MHRHALATLLAVGALAQSLQAECVDTLFVSRITSYDGTFKIGDAGPVPTKTEVPLNALNAIGPKAGSLKHLLKFAAPCDDGLIGASPANSVTLRDSSYRRLGTEYHDILGRFEAETRKVELGTNVEYTGITDRFDMAFEISTPGERGIFYVSRHLQTQPLVGYEAHKMMTKSMKLNGQRADSITVWDPYSKIDSTSMFDWASGTSDLPEVTAGVASGRYDSVRIRYQVMVYEYSYDRPSVAYEIPSGLLSRSRRTVAAASAIALSRRLDGSWLIAGPKAAPVSIRTLNGRLVRELPAGNSVVWDGLDRAGRPVQAGVYLVEVRGVGHSRIPLAR